MEKNLPQNLTWHQTSNKKTHVSKIFECYKSEHQMRSLLGNVDLHKVVFQGVELYHIRRGRSGTLPEISKSPSENRPGPKRKIVFQASIFFRCELLVSGKVPTSIKCLNTFACEDLNSTRMSWRMIFLVVDFYPKFFYLFATEIVA